MSTVQNILDALFMLAPENLREDWDNVGLLCGHPEREVNRILVALDASDASLSEAERLGCQLLVTHHPVNFAGVKKLTPANVTGKHLLFAAEKGIACVNLHTNLDSVSGGVNDLLADRLGMINVTMPAPRGVDAQGREFGYLRVGTVPRQTLCEFAAFVKQRLSCPGVRFCDGGRPVFRVAVGGGECGDEIDTALAAGCDTFVTSDLKYHQFCDAADSGLNLVDAGHFETESPVCTLLVSFLREKFPQTETLLSRDHGDVVRFL